MFTTYRGQISNFGQKTDGWKKIGYVVPNNGTNMVEDLFERRILDKYEYCTFTRLIVSEVKKNLYLPRGVERVKQDMHLMSDDMQEWKVRL